MPGVSRYGNNKLKEFLEPLVNNGLSSVLLFGVMDNTPKVGFYDEWLVAYMAINFMASILGRYRHTCRFQRQSGGESDSEIKRMVSQSSDCLRCLFMSIYASWTLWYHCG